MADFDPSPSAEIVEEVRHRWRAATDTGGRVYDAILGIAEPTPYTDIAEIAGCSPNAAKNHLERLSELGIVRDDCGSRPFRFERNDAYLEWREANRIADELTVEAILERVQRLENRRKEFKECFGTADPSSVSVFDQADHEAIHERMDAVSEWHAIDRDIRLYELAGQIVRNDGHLLPE